MNTKVFVPEVKVLEEFTPTATIEELSQETSVYAASPDFVRKHCGPIANRILDAVPLDYYKQADSLGLVPNIDVRVHRLNTGEYPAVPGWHCDGVLRETYFGAPQLDRIQIRNTVLATVSTGDVSNFEILEKPFEVDIPKEIPEQENVLGLWKYVNGLIEESNPKTIFSKDGKLYQISVNTLHRCTAAKIRGWRLFFRMSMWHNDYLGEDGKIATQQQVYVPLGQGW